MAITIKRDGHNFPVAKTLTEEKFTSYREDSKKYITLLHTIATNLGLVEKESMKLAEYVCIIGERSFGYQKEKFTLRIWLSKVLVHNCIFKISSALFSQKANTADFFQANNYLNSSAVFKLPISCRTVYILVHSMGFTVPEVAQILNINPLQVRERLSKAMAIIKSQRL